MCLHLTTVGSPPHLRVSLYREPNNCDYYLYANRNMLTKVWNENMLHKKNHIAEMAFRFIVC